MIARKKGRVVVAMSGGVDSSAAAALLVRRGYEVIGITIKLWPKEECGFQRETSCCSLEAIRDARFVADRLKIPFYVLDLHNEFKKNVIDYFSSEYLNGRTPNPCIACNQKIKFGALLSKARELNAGHVATGHYANVSFDKRSHSFILSEGKDKEKDQSYVLFSLSQEQLSKALFPLGSLTKEKVRRYAARLRLPTHNKKESQEICFVYDSYATYLKERFKEDIKPGPIVDKEGKVLGAHKGIPFYTVGQREGLGIAHKHALYVIKIDKDKNTITVGPAQSRFFTKIIVEDLNWISSLHADTNRAEVKIRSQHKKANATLNIIGDKVEIVFDHAQESPTPGQAAVFYNKDKVLGGGWIREILS